MNILRIWLINLKINKKFVKFKNKINKQNLKNLKTKNFLKLIKK